MNGPNSIMKLSTCGPEKVMAKEPEVDQSVSKSVAHFYNEYGWVDQGDGKLGEDLLYRHRQNPSYQQYTARSADRTLALLADQRGSLFVCRLW
jgi:hypothetical protein